MPDAPAAQLQPGTLRVIPIGGLGEIGRNMTVYEIDGKILIVDCGVLFPEETPAGRRPDPARLLARSGTASTTSSASCSRTATRTTSAPCPTC